MDAVKYRHVALGLIFPKFVSDVCIEVYDELKVEPEEIDENRALNVISKS